MTTLLGGMSAAALTWLNHAALIPLAICPKAPPGAQKYVDDITGYVLWGVGSLFVVGVIVAVGGIVGGRVFSMPHASKAGVVGIFVVIISAVALVVAMGILAGIRGNGCI